ncbi:MAG: hypothetical protein U0797_14100 [Gemmataceae bacterium]
MIALRPVNQIPAAMTTPPPDATATPHPDEVNRLWQHGLHEEKLFYDRLNYFSAIQVGLLGVFAILYHKEPSVGVFVPLTAAALAFALLWLRVQVRHWRYCVHVYEQIRRVVPEYARTVAAFAKPGRTDGLSIGRPLAFAVPLLFAATWVALFAWVVARASG